MGAAGEQRDSDVRLSFVTRQLPAILWTTDRELRFVSAVGAGLEHLGLSENQVAGMKLSEFFAADPEGPARLAAHEAALEGKSHSTEARFSGRAYQVRIDPLRDRSGQITGTIGIALDVTDRLKSEEAVQRSEARYRLIAAATNDVVWDWNIETDVLEWNDAIQKVFAHGAEQIGHDAAWRANRIHPADRERVLGTLAAALRGHDTTWSDEYRFRRGDGVFAVVMDRGFIARDVRGRAVRMIGSMVDVTERRLIETKLVQAERLASMGTLAAGVAHEINNPLTYVMANIGFVSERLAKFELPGAATPGQAADVAAQLKEMRTALHEAQEGAIRVRQIVRDMRVFARRDDDEPRPIDVVKVLESSLGMAAAELGSGIELIKTIRPVPPVSGSESRLGQVFVNLLINAAQAVSAAESTGSGLTLAQRPHRISVATQVDDLGNVVVTVEDTGPGIPTEILGRIFEPFFTTKPVGVGTGLGLFICHGIVRAMGGSLHAESDPHQGTRFRVVLPAARSPAPVLEAGAAPDDVVGAASSWRLLVIDDDPHVARGLQRSLLGHDVVLADSGRRALEILAADRRYDAIVCDLVMPDLSGVDVFAFLQRADRDLARRTVFISGGALPDEVRELLSSVANPRLEKPFDLARLRLVIRGLIEGQSDRALSERPDRPDFL